MTDFRRITNQVLSTAKNGRIGIRAFETNLLQIAKQIRQDAQSAWLGVWGQSLNYDEHEQAQIVDPKLLNVIGRIAQHPIRDGRSYHAGLMHTYGYLLSNLKTRFGYKRKRWTDGLIESSLSLEPGVLSPRPGQGTLLQNVSFMMSQIAFPTEQQKPALPTDTIPDSLQRVRFDRLNITRITEEVQLSSSRKRLKIYTDLVRFKPACPLDYLLVYSIKSGSTSQLITCFPTNTISAKELLANAESNDTPIRPRFNLAFDNFPTTGLNGKRTVVQR